MTTTNTWVKNLSSIPITKAKEHLLAHGPNFAITPKHPPNGGIHHCHGGRGLPKTRTEGGSQMNCEQKSGLLAVLKKAHTQQTQQGRKDQQGIKEGTERVEERIKPG